MTATERLRELLDERGVKWWSKPRLVVSGVEKGTEFDAADGSWVHAIEALDGTICVSHLTPEQAIAATLGVGTCKNVHEPPRNTTFWPTPHFKCSECGATHVSMDYVYFCPNCGKRVVE